MAQPLRSWRQKQGAVEHRHTEHTREIQVREEKLPAEYAEAMQRLAAALDDVHKRIATHDAAMAEIDHLKAKIARLQGAQLALIEHFDSVGKLIESEG